MSSMPERDAAGQDQHEGMPPGGIPGQPASGPAGGQPSGGQPMGGQWNSQQGVWGDQPGSMTPVYQAETRVTWRRIFQYWIDAFFVSVIPYLVSIPFDRSGSTV